MANMETLGILEEIQTLVSDKLQVVSYKWLSRNYLVSSNAAKRLLQEFVEKNGNGFEVVYTLAGWLKSTPPSYHIRLVSGTKLEEAKHDFDGTCSILVYSVQACIPKDPAALWNAEFVQAEELFKQPVSVDNCLRDNRFCGVINSCVKRNVEGAARSITATQAKSIGVSGKSSVPQNVTVPPPQQTNLKQSVPKGSLKSPNEVEAVKTESNGAELCDRATKPPANKDPFPANKNKVKNDKTASGTGGAIANMWGRASAKPKPTSPPANKNDLPNPTDAQISAHDELEDGSSDDDAQDVNMKRVSNVEGTRKRRVVLDYSDEEEFQDVVNIASPDYPKGKSCLELKQTTTASVSGTSNLNLDKKKEETKVKEEKSTNNMSNQLSGEDSSPVRKSMNMKTSPTDKIESCVAVNHVKKDSAPKSPKRRKVLKTRIDDRGREVTEVVWEGEKTDKEKVDNNATKKVDNSTATNAINRQPAVKKGPAAGHTAQSNATVKTGSKKMGNAKDPKQGNILSFFKKV
ncbi:DNA polymerase delta subunit 3 [Tripterygium wilfordii]|uniref:DNA polymerase delta subunit 3 n=1 Tax=Tripterygium wilfordii TaxID=458696 RepID=A0A7J7CA55_TRIWF|nr:uncharacterized protein LOC119985044 [Tripterygium wilfordii]KAF5730747.1 DNA polymerase delta subunit 3 [Tripterygium wilfordii]